MVHSAASERDATATGVSDRNRALCIAIIIELGKQNGIPCDRPDPWLESAPQELRGRFVQSVLCFST